MAGPHIAVAGGGLIGLSIAWRLARAGFSVTLFEKNTPGAEASWAGAGMLAPGGEFDGQSPLTSLALASRQIYPEFLRELEHASRTAIDYQECGALDVAYTAAEWDELQQRAQRQADVGIACRQLDRKRVTTLWPRVRSEDLYGGYFYPGDAIVNPREMVAALLIACREAGVTIRERTPVDEIDLLDERVDIFTGGSRERYSAAIVAAGAWSSLIPVKHAPPLPPSFPVRGHLVGWAQPDQTCNTIIRHGHTYLLQRANGLLIAGASVEHAGWDRTVDPAIAAELVDNAAFVLPHLAETTPSELWVGFRPGSDELRLGRWSSPHLYLAYGHYRNGILLAPATAAAILDELNASSETLRRGFASGR